MLGKIFDLLGTNFIALIIGTLLGGEITRFLYKPNVIIQLQGLVPLYSENGFFISVRIANRGRTVSSNSLGKITIKYDENNLMEPNDYQLDAFEVSLPTYRLENIKLDFPRHQLVTPNKLRSIKNSALCWSTLGNPNKVDINPGSTENLDICRVQLYVDEKTNRKFWYLIFPSEEGWKKVRCRIKLITGIPVVGKLFVCPSNVFPTVKIFSIIQRSPEEPPTFSIKSYSFFQKLYNSFNRSKLYFD